MDEATKLLTPGVATQEATRLLPTAGAAGAVAAVDAADEPQKKKRSPWTWPLVALIVLLLIVLGGTLFALREPGARSPRRRRVPRLLDAQPLRDAPVTLGEPHDGGHRQPDSSARRATRRRPSLKAGHQRLLRAGIAAPTQDQVGKIYQTNPTGNVKLSTRSR
jgi:serine/threonine-protein kinase